MPGLAPEQVESFWSEGFVAYPNNVYFGAIPDGERPSFPDRPAA